MLVPLLPLRRLLIKLISDLEAPAPHIANRLEYSCPGTGRHLCPTSHALRRTSPLGQPLLQSPALQEALICCTQLLPPPLSPMLCPSPAFSLRASPQRPWYGTVWESANSHATQPRDAGSGCPTAHFFISLSNIPSRANA